MRIKSLFVLLFAATLLILPWACKKRAETQLQSTDPIELGPPGELSPESFAVLLPVLNWEQTPQANLIPLRQFVSPSAYSSILTAVTPTDSIEFNPLGTDIREIPFDEWYVTGFRFALCDSPEWAVSSGWLASSLPSGESVYRTVCKPRIRVSVQRLGTTTEGKVIFDDKSMHMVFNFFGKDLVDKTDIEHLLAVENKIAADLGNPNLDLASFQAAVAAGYDARTQDTLKRLKFGLLDIARQNTPQNAGNLRIPYGGTADGVALKVARQSNYLKENLLSDTRLSHLTLTFSATGKTVASSRTWTFAALTLQGEQATLIVQNAAVDGDNSTRPFAPTGRIMFSPGRIFTFTDDVTEAAVDRDLANTFRKTASALGNQILFYQGLYNRAAFKKNPTDPTVSLLDGVGNARFAPKFDKLAYETINNPNHDGGGCLGCHLATPMRFGQAGNLIRPIIDSKMPFLANLLTSSENLNIGTAGFGLGSNDNLMKPSWVLRQLGYFGRSPCIGDRLAVEVDRDFQYAKVLLAARSASAVATPSTAADQNP